MSAAKQNRLLIAGAGTGKTYQLVQQFISLLKEGIPPERLAAITFTEAAAAELLERIREKAPSSLDLSAATITTLHGFCASLLRERPVEAGVPPHFEVLDALGRELLLEKLWESWIEEQLDHEGPIATARMDGLSRADLRKLTFALLEHQDRLESLAQNPVLPRALCAFVEVFREAKRQRSQLDFNDLLLLTRKLLRENADLLAHFRRRYDQILIDEFQDTDPLQAEIVWLLASEGELPENWWEITPAPGRLFVVGDPHQSIYRFRRADVDLFQSAAAAIERGHDQAREHLRTNRRSIPRIVRMVNSTFQTELEHLRQDEEFPQGGVTVLLPSTQLDGLPIERVREAEAAAIAQFLHEQRGEIPLGECAILFKSLTDVDIYEEALISAKLPFFIEGAKSYYKRREVKQLIAWLRAVENPLDSLAIVAVLRSPFFGVSDAELAQHRANGGVWDYRKATVSDTTPKLCAAFERLRLSHEKRHEHSISATLEKLFEESGILGLIFLQPGGEQRVANCLQAVRLARELESREPLTFSSFVHYLFQSETRLREETLPGISEGDEAIRLMTMHKSKGLEFRLVVLADLCRKQPFFTDPLIYRRQERSLEFQLGKKSGFLLKSDGYEKASQEEEQALSEERKRLFYVAATRARDMLVIPRFPSGGEKGPDKSSFYHFLPESIRSLNPDTKQTELAGLSLWHAENPLGTRYVPGTKESTELKNLLREREEFLKQRAKQIASRPVATVSLSPSQLSPEKKESLGHGKKAGIAVHRVLSRCDFKDIQTARKLLEVESASLNAEEMKHALHCLENAYRLPFFASAAKVKRVFRELPFEVTLDGQWISGVVDLLYEEQGAWHLLDYKTDSISQSQISIAAEHYATQLKLYARALESILKAPIAQISLTFLAIPAEYNIQHPN